MAPSSDSTTPTSSQPLLANAECTDPHLNGHDIHVLMRRINALEAENALISSKMNKKPPKTLIREGRAVRRLVALVQLVSDMVNENDRCQLCVHDDGVTMETVHAESTLEQNRSFRNFQKLRSTCPTIAKLITEGLFDVYACREVQSGADGAWGDDASSLKGEVLQWLPRGSTEHEPALLPRDKEGHGMNNPVTGQLLCPVDYNWADSSVREAIREYHPNYRVTAYSWPAFLYQDYTYDASNPSQGLFRSDILVKAFKHIFTSPSSTRCDSSLRASPSQSHKSRTRRHVAELLEMRSVQPRAIAYVAAQLRFALSSASSWVVIDEDFDYDTFYYHIVDYLEAPRTLEKKAELKTLFLWWNRSVFGRQNAMHYHPLQTESLSMSRSSK